MGVIELNYSDGIYDRHPISLCTHCEFTLFELQHGARTHYIIWTHDLPFFFQKDLSRKQIVYTRLYMCDALEYSTSPNALYIDLHDLSAILRVERLGALHECLTFELIEQKLARFIKRSQSIRGSMRVCIKRSLPQSRVRAVQREIVCKLAMREYLTNPHNCEAAIEAWIAQWQHGVFLDMESDVDSDVDKPPKKRTRYSNAFEMACSELSWVRLQEEVQRVSAMRTFQKLAMKRLMEKCKPAAERVYATLK